ncbi:MAG: holo-ACP synthase [Lachnospiraceae bacterium]|nr:holo-ACP synthase [Lachnospiraceae bacterium]
MIYGIGTDIVEISRVEKALEQSGRFLERYYTEKECGMIRKRGCPQKAAAINFAGKEAVAKALQTGINGRVRLEDIEILRKESGAPYVTLYNGAFQYAEKCGIKRIHISLSDTEELAVAYAIAET